MKNKLLNYLLRARIWSDDRGQDMVEYAMLVGLMTILGGSVSAGVSEQIQIIFDRILELLELA